MQCPKCQSANSDAAQFCTRCHATLRFLCPSCRHSQDHGGACDACGVDFGKYAAMLVAQEQIDADKEHARVRERVGLWKQVFLLPITGGFSLLKHFFGSRNT
jgi:hypothetical protein